MTIKWIIRFKKVKVGMKEVIKSSQYAKYQYFTVFVLNG